MAGPCTGGWWCCCNCGCVIVQDNFDRAPNTFVGTKWNECPDDEQGDWQIAAKSRPLYDQDRSLWEYSGDGVLLANWREQTPSQFLRYETISEQYGNRYQILLKVHETNPKSCHPGAHLLVEFYCGDGSTVPHTLTAYYVSAGGAKTTIGSSSFYIPLGEWNGDTHGRHFYASYIAEHNLLCAAVSHHVGTPRAWLLCRDITPQTGQRAGVGNASDDALSIEIDNFEWWRLENPAPATPDGKICFGCLCKCKTFDAYGNVTDVALYPPVLHLRMQGQCCTPAMTPCDTSGCPGAIDTTIELTWTQDYPSPLIDSWVGTANLCGVDMEFRFVCSEAGPSALYICVAGAPGGCYGPASAAANGQTVIRSDWTCHPINVVWDQHFGSLSTFQCCLYCTSGDYTYTLTE